MWRSKILAEIEAQRALLRTRAGLAAGLGVLAFVTLIGLIWLWPNGERQQVDASRIVISTGVLPAEVTSVEALDCPVENTPGCQRVGLRLTDGPAKGSSSYLILPGDDATPRLSPGDAIRVTPNTQSFGNVPPEVIALGPRVGFLSLVGLGVGLVLYGVRRPGDPRGVVAVRGRAGRVVRGDVRDDRARVRHRREEPRRALGDRR